MAQRDKYPNDKRVIKFLKDNYPPDWTYHNFGPQLTMEFFDAKEWADIVADSGAKYAQQSNGQTSLHVRLCS